MQTTARSLWFKDQGSYGSWKVLSTIQKNLPDLELFHDRFVQFFYAKPILRVLNTHARPKDEGPIGYSFSLARREDQRGS